LRLIHWTCASLHSGELEIHAEARTNTRDSFCACFRGYKLANKDGFFGTSDPFLVISRYATFLHLCCNLTSALVL
jgi:hypothetical protein